MKRIFLFIIILSCCCWKSLSFPSIIRIGGIFESRDSDRKEIFLKAAEQVNNDFQVFPNIKLEVVTVTEVNDSFQAHYRTCDLLTKRVAAIFSFGNQRIIPHVQSICDHVNIPHIHIGQCGDSNSPGNSHLNFFPSLRSLYCAYSSIIKMFKWNKYVIFYDQVNIFEYLEDLVNEIGQRPNSIVHISDKVADHRPMLKTMKTLGMIHFVLDCSLDSIHILLKQAQQLGMTSSTYGYLLTSLDAHLMDMDDFRYGGANITILKLIVHNEYRSSSWGTNSKFIDQIDEKIIKTETALIFDAVYLFSLTLERISEYQYIKIPNINCEDASRSYSNASVYRDHLLDRMKNLEMYGSTGLIKFDPTGYRSDIQLEILTLKEPGIEFIGTWNSTYGLSFTGANLKNQETLRSRTMRIVTILNEPFFTEKKTMKQLNGNDKYEGYVVDLTQEIAKILNFDYTFHVVGDKRYGSLNSGTQHWNGIVKELIDRKADFSVADLTITFDREEVLDFTTPFMQLGIGILYFRPLKTRAYRFSFFSPLSQEVWISIAIAYFGVSVALYRISKLSPYEIRKIRITDIDPELRSSKFSFHNTLWFVIGCLLQQGCDFTPTAVSTRFAAGIWWFFSMIMISSYTANLAAFLTIERMEFTIGSIEDLAQQSSIKYGLLKGGSTEDFFRYSNISLYQRMWSTMESDDSVFVSSTADGVTKVKNSAGRYALLMESPLIDYYTSRECQLIKIGGPIDSKGYGIAFPPQSPFLTDINRAILRLQENNILENLKSKWWKPVRPARTCPEDKTTPGARALTLENIIGVFILLIVGLLISLAVAIIEILWHVKKKKLERETESSDDDSPDLEDVSTEVPSTELSSTKTPVKRKRKKFRSPGTKKKVSNPKIRKSSVDLKKT